MLIQRRYFLCRFDLHYKHSHLHKFHNFQNHCRYHPRKLRGQRSQFRLKGERLEKRIRHWQGVITSACEQCGRCTLPELLPPDEYASRLNNQAYDGLKLMLQPDSTVTLQDLEPPEGSIHLLVGPEGGLNPEEQTFANNTGFTGIRLGQRILRTETAALAALAGMQTLWGDFI